MLNLLRKLSVQNINRAIVISLFFLLFFLYLWLAIDVRLIYHGVGIFTNFPVFFKDWSFFQKFISNPAGPLEYICAFLAQFFYYSWAGALVVTLQAVFMFLCTDYILRSIKALRIC